MSSHSKDLEILLASHELFTKFGYSKTTMEDIGEKVGLNQASLYHYFRNKEELFLNVVLYCLSKLKENIEIALNKEQDLESKLATFFIVKFDFLQRDSLLRQVIDLNLKKIPFNTKKRIKALLNTEKEIIASIFQEAIDTQEISEIDVLKTAEIMIHLTEGIRFAQIRQMVLDSQKRSRKEILDELRLAISYFMNGIKQKKGK